MNNSASRFETTLVQKKELKKNYTKNKRKPSKEIDDEQTFRSRKRKTFSNYLKPIPITTLAT